MSITTPELIRNCRRCSRELPAGALACQQCHALVHSQALERLAAEAKTLEAKGEFWQAREQWLAGLPLLPPASRQANWIHQHLRSLEVTANQIQSPSAPSENKWAQRLGPVGPIAILIAKSKVLLGAIFKLKS